MENILEDFVFLFLKKWVYIISTYTDMESCICFLTNVGTYTEELDLHHVMEEVARVGSDGVAEALEPWTCMVIIEMCNSIGCLGTMVARN